MAHATTPSLVRQIGSLFDGGSVAGLSDRQLIDRFVARRDAAGEAAFAALVARHGPMVLGVCRQLFGDRHHAEDTFQAVFLVLARKAGSIRNPDLLGNWLYGVALRTARKGKARLGHQRRIEEGDAGTGPGAGTDATVEPMTPSADQPAIDREQAELLHDEIDRLPGSFRLPVVLCYFEGLTLDEAARRLHCPPGTLRSRLARARDKLRRGLTRRGVVLPAAALTAVLDARPASASVSSPLCDMTTRAAIQFAAAQAASPPAAALAQEIVKSMLFHKLKVLALACLLLGAAVTGAGYLTHALAMPDEPRPVPARPQPQIASKPADAQPGPAPGRMFVVGRVLDPNGKPVPRATVAVYARSVTIGADTPSPRRLIQRPIGNARADGSGRFRIDAPRTSSSRYDRFGAIALAPGHGVGWVELDPDDDQPTADITLLPEQVIHGRLLDPQGQPISKVTITVATVRRTLPSGPARARSRFDGVVYSTSKINDVPAWPWPVMTDAEGRFTVRGLGRGLGAGLTVHHPRFALQRIPIEPDGTAVSKSITVALLPAQVVTGRVTYADTGAGVPHAPLEVTSFHGNGETETDAEGRFRVIAPPTDRGIRVDAFPPAGQPYLIARKGFDWPKGAVEQSVDLALPRGASVHGTVTEEGTDQPVAGAIVDFVAYAQRHNGQREGPVAETAADGSFRLGTVAGPGHLFVKGPSDDYVLREISGRMMERGQPGESRVYSHAVSFLDLKLDSESQHVPVVLRRGATVTGQVVGPDGQPVRQAWIFSRVILNPRQGAWHIWQGSHHGNVRNGRFEIHGLDPETEVPVYFLEPNGKLGGGITLSGKSAASGPVTVRLGPCGAARARIVGPDGKPVVGRLPRFLIEMIITPGIPFSIDDKTGLPSASTADVNVVNTVNYPATLVSDAQGRLTLPVLIPGATYRFTDRTTFRRGETGPTIRKEFTVKPGETLDLGDIRIEKPQPVNP